MKPTTDQTEMQVYGSEAAYRTPPNESQIAAGVVPLDTLPAAWWNWLWNGITKNNNGSLVSIGDLRAEVMQVLVDAGITPSEASQTQLLTAILTISQRYSTASTPGAIRSSSDIRSVSVSPTDGTAIVNAMSDWVGTQTIETRVATAEQSIAEAKEEVDEAVEGLPDEVKKLVNAHSRVFVYRRTDSDICQFGVVEIPSGGLVAVRGYTEELEPEVGDIIVLLGMNVLFDDSTAMNVMYFECGSTDFYLPNPNLVSLQGVLVVSVAEPQEGTTDQKCAYVSGGIEAVPTQTATQSPAPTARTQLVVVRTSTIPITLPTSTTIPLRQGQGYVGLPGGLLHPKCYSAYPTVYIGDFDADANGVKVTNIYGSLSMVVGSRFVISNPSAFRLSWTWTTTVPCPSLVFPDGTHFYVVPVYTTVGSCLDVTSLTTSGVYWVCEVISGSRVRLVEAPGISLTNTTSTASSLSAIRVYGNNQLVTAANTFMRNNGIIKYCNLHIVLSDYPGKYYDVFRLDSTSNALKSSGTLNGAVHYSTLCTRIATTDTWDASASITAVDGIINMAL